MFLPHNNISIFFTLFFITYHQTNVAAMPVDRRIHYGLKVNMGDYPGMVSLVLWSTEEDISACSGMVLDEYTVLTAAHCLTSLKPHAYNLSSKWIQTVTASYVTHKSHEDALNFVDSEFQRYIHPEYFMSGTVLTLNLCGRVTC
jgi:hypothetical protein